MIGKYSINNNLVNAFNGKIYMLFFYSLWISSFNLELSTDYIVTNKAPHASLMGDLELNKLS